MDWDGNLNWKSQLAGKLSFNEVVKMSYTTIGRQKEYLGFQNVPKGYFHDLLKGTFDIFGPFLPRKQNFKLKYLTV